MEKQIPLKNAAQVSNHRSTAIATDQVTGSVAHAANLLRQAHETAALSAQEVALEKALAEMVVPREFILQPGHILGSEATKHGEIAEVVEVGITRARDALYQRAPTAADASSRTAPEDYRIGGNHVQSKFYNGANNTLGGVEEHMDTYTWFGRDGSYYHIPKDQYALIERVRAGETEGLSKKTVSAILEKVNRIEERTGKPFNDVVRPASTDYSGVQMGKVEETLDKLDEDLKRTNEQLKEDIRLAHEASLAEGLKVAVSAGAVAGAFAFVVSSAHKYFDEGKNIFKGDFTKSDWKDVGLDTLTGGLTGAVTGGAVYAMTNYGGMAAPLAAAFVSATKGVGSLVVSFSRDEISIDQLVDEALLVCADVAVVGLFSAVGQAVIPVPVLGALIGSFAGKAVSDLLGGKVKNVAAVIEKRLDEHRANLDKEYRLRLDSLKAKYLPLQALTSLAFDVKQNVTILESSIALARMHGVAERLILKNEVDVLDYLRSQT